MAGCGSEREEGEGRAWSLAWVPQMGFQETLEVRGGALLHEPTEDMKPGAAGWPSGEAMPVFLSQPDRRASYLPLLQLRKGHLRGQKDPSLLGTRGTQSLNTCMTISISGTNPSCR